MAGTNVITSLGASDIDTKELTANLVKATKEPRQKLIDAEKKRAQVGISSAALLKNGLAALQVAATEIASAPKLNQLQVTSTNASAISASSNPNKTADAGNYFITVEALAAPKRLMASFATNYVTSSSVTLTLTGVVGTKAGADPNISVGVGKTPTDIVSAINEWVKANAPDSGLSATLLNTGKETNPTNIVLQSASGATNNGLQITSTAPELDFTQLTPATNARFTVNGIAMERASNQISDVASGLSLEFNSLSAAPVVITAKPDPSPIVQNIQNFVDTYNTVADFLKKATGPKVEGDDVAGSLQNDSSARGVLARLRSIITAPFSELGTKPVSVTHWSSLGVEFDRNGVLQFQKQSKCIAAFAKSPQDVVIALSNGAPSPYLSSKLPSGLAGDVARVSYEMLSSADGVLPAMSKSYQDKLSRADKKQESLDAYVARITASYEKQFSAMNSALASFKSTQSQLTNAMNLNSKS